MRVHAARVYATVLSVFVLSIHVKMVSRLNSLSFKSVSFLLQKFH